MCIRDSLYTPPVKPWEPGVPEVRNRKERPRVKLVKMCIRDRLYIYYEQEEASIHHILTEKQIPFHWIYLISSEKQYEDLELSLIHI